MDSSSLNPYPLKEHRADRRSARRKQLGKSLWQFLVITSLATGLAYSVRLPYWSITESSQVEVVGNQLLTEAQVKKLLQLDYPQSLWRLPLGQLRQRLRQTPPLQEATLTRQVFPPRLLVKIGERQPVVIAYQNRTPGYLDAQGVFIPRTFYAQTPANISPATVKVFGYTPQYQEKWAQVYALVQNFSPKISEVHWQNPNNFVLKSELGKVYFGPLDGDFPEQMEQLAQLQSLGKQIPLSDIVYIDLSNPSLPAVQLRQKPQKKSLDALVRKQ
jgi:cell division protein FtsQ